MIFEKLTVFTQQSIQALAISNNGAILAAAMYGAAIYLWRTEDLEYLGTLPHPASEYGTMSGLVLNHDGSLLINVCDNSLLAWDVPGRRLRQRLVEPPDDLTPPDTRETWDEFYPYVLSLSSNGHSFACGSQGDGRIKVWSAQTLNEIGQIRAHTSVVMALAFNPVGTLLASSGYEHDTSVSVWDLDTGRHSTLAIPQMHWLTGLAFHPAGRLLAGCGLSTASRAQKPAPTIHIWDMETGELCQSLLTNTPVITRVAFHPDGRLLASGAADGQITLWDTATWEPLTTVHSACARDLSALFFSPDGQVLFSSGDVAAPEQLTDQGGTLPLTHARGIIEVWQLEC